MTDGKATDASAGDLRAESASLRQRIEALELENRRLRLSERMANKSPEMKLCLKGDGSVCYLNEAACRALGIGTACTGTLKAWDVVANACESAWADLWEAWTRRESHVRMLRLRHAQGHTLHAEAAFVLTRNQGEPCLMLFARDASERVALERALAESQERYDFLAESSRDGILLLRGTRIVECNKVALQLAGQEDGDLRGREILEFVDPASAESIRAWFREGYREPLGIEYSPPGSDEAFHLELTVRRPHYLGPRGFLLIVRDVTERTRKEEVLREAARQAELAAETRTRFLANMSHEIRTPLNGVIGMTGLLLETKLRGEQLEFANAIRTSGQTLLALVNDILDFSKIEAGRMELELLPFDLRGQIEDVLELLAPKAHGKGLRFSAIVPPSVPTQLIGDPGRIRQILINLIDNAIKFTNDGEVVVEVSCIEEGQKEAQLRFDVRDTGIGIPADKIRTLFSPFTQADTSSTRRFEGTGLGLAICRQLAALMNGVVELQSAKGVGSVFSFTVPLQKQETHQTATDFRRNRNLIRKLRVLLVDSHNAHRRNLMGMLGGWQVPVREASSGEEAARLMQEHFDSGVPFDIVLVDSGVDDGEGVALAEKLHERFGSRTPLLVLLSSLGSNTTRRNAFSRGFADLLSKPVKQGALFDCLVNVATPSEYVRRTRQLPPRREQPKLDLRVLVVEDNTINQTVALRMLQKLGCRCDAVANGIEALEAIRAIPYDIVLMDCQMPEMDGFQATREIRSLSNPALATIPIVAMTAHALEGDRARCLEAGMDDYISKPLIAERLASALHAWAGKIDRRAAPDKSASPQRPPQPKTLDLTRLESIAEGDHEFLRELLASFQQDLDRNIAKLEAAFEQRNPLAIKQAAHTIRGSARNVGADNTGRIAEALETLATHAPPNELGSVGHEIGRLIDELRSEAGRVSLRIVKELAP